MLLLHTTTANAPDAEGVANIVDLNLLGEELHSQPTPMIRRFEIANA
jgi:hypothetical protein